MKKVGKYIGICCLVYLVICVIVAISGYEPKHDPPMTLEAQKLASQTFVTHKDGTLTRLEPKTAAMMIETCTMLAKMKFSDMTPNMLDVWNDCRSHGIGR
jgi:hypothetical protein